MNRFLLPLLLLLFVFVDCKKKAPEGLFYGFVISPNGVTLWKAPGDFKNKVTVIKEDESFSVLKEKIADPKLGDKKFWYEIATKSGETGFISYDEALLNKTVSIFFKPEEREDFGVVTATNLNVRERPDLASKSLTLIPQFTLVRILSKGSLEEKVKGNRGNWLEVEYQDGKNGFAFSSFINLYSEAEAKQAVARREISLSGYFLVQRNPVFTTTPNGTKVQTQGSSENDCGYLDVKYFPSKDEFGVVTSKAEVNGKSYYLIEMYEYRSYECSNYATGWIEASQGKFLTAAEFSEHTLKTANTSLEPKDIAALRSLENANGINFETTTLSPLTQGGESKNLHLLEVAFGSKNSNGGGDLYIGKYLLQRGEASSTIISGEIPGELVFEDLDNDGYPEILATTSERGGNNTNLLGYKNGSYSSAMHSGFDGYSGNSVEITPEKTVKVTTYDYTEGPERITETYYRYSKGILKKL